MNDALDIWKLIAGIGVFLFGMYMLEDSLKRLSGRTFRNWLRNSTDSAFKAIATGAGTTALVQSSSAVSLMVLALTGAGVLAMENAIGVILGSNLGTTLTSWLVALLGFKIEIQRFAFPFVGLGGLGIIFLKNSARYSNISRFMVGFGFIFLGIDFMKSAVETMSSGWQTAISSGSPGYLFLVAGIAVAAITQSSSAALAMTLTSVHSGLISFDQAALVVIGANVGTTITVFIGSIGSDYMKKRVALGHFIFNFVTGGVAMLLIMPFSYLINDVMELHDDPELSIAAFHTVFNFFGILLFLPFIPRFTSLLSRVYPDRQKQLGIYVSQTSHEIPDAALEAVRKELRRLALNVTFLNLLALRIKRPKSSEFRDNVMPHKNFGELYDQVKILHSEIATFASKTLTSDLNMAEAGRIQHYLQTARALVLASKQSKDIVHYLESLDSSELKWIDRWLEESRKASAELFDRLIDLVGEALPSSDDYNDLISLVDKEDDRALQLITSSIASAQTQDESVSNVLLTNRLIHQSQQSIITALRDLTHPERTAD